MTIVTADKDAERLEELSTRLREMYPGATVAAYTDLYLAAQYVNRHMAELAFVEGGRDYYEALEFARLASVYSPGIKTFIVTEGTQRLDTGNWVYVSGLLTRPVTNEKLLALTQIPAVGLAVSRVTTGGTA